MRGEEEASASLPHRRGDPTRWPGAWQAAVIAALMAGLAGYLGRPSAGAFHAEGAPGISRIGEVAPNELPEAAETVSGTPGQMGRTAERDPCGRRLASVTLVRAPSQPPGRIRLQSGNYVSPDFELFDTPVRVAIPFPAPYATGHGMISVIGTTTDAVVALTPSWHAAAHAGIQTREVRWTPVAGCPAAGNR